MKVGSRSKAPVEERRMACTIVSITRIRLKLQNKLVMKSAKLQRRNVEHLDSMGPMYVEYGTVR